MSSDNAGCSIQGITVIAGRLPLQAAEKHACPLHATCKSLASKVWIQLAIYDALRSAHSSAAGVRPALLHRSQLYIVQHQLYMLHYASTQLF
jgi:hypothetical protein